MKSEMLEHDYLDLEILYQNTKVGSRSEEEKK